MTRWTTVDIPPQNGRSALVTGTGGIGFEVALALAHAGAEVIVAGRNPAKGAQAVAQIHAAVPGAKVRFEVLDLANLASIAALGQRLRNDRQNLDMLINNAGVMVPPKRRETADGFELQLGTNHLGHVALTAELMPLLRAAPAGRVIALSSIAARGGAIDFDDLNCTKSYRPMKAYSASKLACLLFAFELQRQSDAGGWGISSIAAHPGVARTDLLHTEAGKLSVMGLTRSMLWFLFQPAAQGALPVLYAATSAQAKPGGYYGPDRFSEGRGYPTDAKPPLAALNQKDAARLWEMSLALTGARFPS